MLATTKVVRFCLFKNDLYRLHSSFLSAVASIAKGLVF